MVKTSEPDWKTCPTCQRPFAGRRTWAKVRTQIRYRALRCRCCRGSRPLRHRPHYP
ncbi:DUF2256 domain-containing protein [Aliiroseovarius zhejiangensis]|uniref:DUF2256 domain-containing protein n=1 Tax=Aliiroseovarius zhejiangensis TaxID=1632025 RepID=UPI00174C54FC|nr:DUF2256 domain-containing protein [Aliiroseovarius zhejiangensis]